MNGPRLVDATGEAIRYCAAIGCNHRATVFPELVIPPTGYPHSRGIRVKIGLALCRKHGLEECPETFLTDQLKAMIRAQLKPSAVPPDFDRAKIDLTPLASKAWEEAVDIARAAQSNRRRRKLNS